MTGDENRPEPLSVDLVRRTTDVRVLDVLMDEELTRPEVARLTAISKVTISESIRRLSALGLVVESGINKGERGRSSLRYRVADDAGASMAIHAGPGEVIAEVVDWAGRVLHRSSCPVGITVSALELLDPLGSVIRDCRGGTTATIRATVASIADPVDRHRRTVRLEGSPFLEDSVDLTGLLGEQAVVGNDVNWAAYAELTDGIGRDPGSFLYCYVGAGIGGAVVDSGRVMLGSTGLAGELAYVVTTAPDGSPKRLLDCFVDLGVVVPGSTVIDVAAVRSIIAAGGRECASLVGALGGALGSMIALLGSDLIILGGPWGAEPGLLAALQDATAEHAPYPVTVRQASFADSAPAVGVRIAARKAARAALGRLV